MAKLDKTFTSKDIFALAFGTMVGWSWIMLSGIWANNAGMLGAVIAFAAGAVMCIFVGLAYAELTPALPYTGGSVVYSFKAMGYWPSVIAGLAACFSYIGIIALEGPAFATAIDYIIKIPRIGYLWTVCGFDVYVTWALIGTAGAVVLTWVNIRGASMTAVFQKTANFGKIGVGVLFVFGGLMHGNTEYVTPLFTDGKGFIATLVMVPAMFVGFDVIPQSAGEMNISPKKIPRLLIISILASAAWYILMIFATCISAPLDVRLTGEIPVADAMAYAFGGMFWGKVCIIGALCGIITAWNGFIFACARCLYAMSNARMLPAFLGKLHPKYNTPYIAVLISGVISAASCFMGKEAISWFVNASSFGVIILYIMDVLALIFLRRKYPEIKRPYMIKRFTPVALAAIIAVVAFGALYMPFGPSALSAIEWSFAVVWFAAGFILALWCRFRYKDVTMEERENALINM